MEHMQYRWDWWYRWYWLGVNDLQLRPDQLKHLLAELASCRSRSSRLHWLADGHQRYHSSNHSAQPTHAESKHSSHLKRTNYGADAGSNQLTLKQWRWRWWLFSSTNTRNSRLHLELGLYLDQQQVENRRDLLLHSKFRHSGYNYKRAANQRVRVPQRQGNQDLPRSQLRVS